MQIRLKFYRNFAILALLGVLGACNGMLSSESQVRKRSFQSTTTASSYLEHLVLASLKPEASKPHLDGMNAYATKKSRKAEQVGLFMMEYKTGMFSRPKPVLAPIPLAKKTEEYPTLATILQLLTEKDYGLYNVHVAKISMTPDPALQIANTPSGNALTDALAKQSESLKRQSQQLGSLEEVQLQLRLIRFFMDQQLRDAAYLTLENAKQSLSALLVQRPHDAEQLGHAIEQLEIELRSKLPYTL